MEFFGSSLILYSDDGLALGARLDLEGPELDVLLDSRFIELSSDEPLSIEDGVGRIPGGLVLGGISDESL